MAFAVGGVVVNLGAREVWQILLRIFYQEFSEANRSPMLSDFFGCLLLNAAKNSFCLLEVLFVDFKSN